MFVDCYIVIWYLVSVVDRIIVFMVKIVIVIIYVVMVWLSVYELWFFRLKEGKCLLDIDLLEVVIWINIIGFVKGSFLFFVLLLFGFLIIVGFIVKGVVLSFNFNRFFVDLMNLVVVLVVFYVLFLLLIIIVYFIYMFYLENFNIYNVYFYEKYRFFIYVMDKIYLGI